VNLRSLSTLQIALGASVAVHAALLTVRFVDPEAFNRVFEDSPLEVILVNAHTREKPDMARAIAQASMAGGGDLDQGRATSPLPPALLAMPGEDTEQEQQRQLRNMQEQQNLMLAKVRHALAAMPPVEPRQAQISPEQAQRDEKRRQLTKLLAEIERRISEESARPKKRYISPATREAAYAVYYDRLRRAIEDKGTENFPQANGQKLYGELTMSVNIDTHGQVQSTTIEQSSGNRTLDRQAQAIVRGAGPFGRFTEEMRRQSDLIVVVSHFKFTRDDTLETKVGAK